MKIFPTISVCFKTTVKQNYNHFARHGTYFLAFVPTFVSYIFILFSSRLKFIILDTIDLFSSPIPKRSLKEVFVI
ncbi:hypothetical protein BAZSYMA_ACONTIG29752_0 [Bathymodiolus azoricus thioautotrophic gill symbiont]|uniref:Uncharacterized protein n=1 Tax=Bathymodiolus azoricus thioautotrophic gill symbiont TaxID=235205 RepID=A0A1H6MIP4_9GAMM|nr:hypothetical protein BAZSYMA_ACONTIG29752_0 [Bathymodiolus azoricus thioautotrophic gill symbiont]